MLEALWLATVIEAVLELEGVGVKVAPGSREKVKVISAVSPVLTAAVLLEARKKAARSLVEAERMSPKPGLSARLTLVYGSKTVAPRAMAEASESRMVLRASLKRMATELPSATSSSREGIAMIRSRDGLEETGVGDESAPGTASKLGRSSAEQHLPINLPPALVRHHRCPSSR